MKATSLRDKDYVVDLPKFIEPPSNAPEEAQVIISKWLGDFNCLLDSYSAKDAKSIIREDAWIRDFLTLSWDFQTVQGKDTFAYIAKQAEQTHLRNLKACHKGCFKPAFINPAPDVHWLQSMFDFETDLGRGKGMVRLAMEESGSWKMYMINFTLQELKSVKVSAGIDRPTGYVDQKGGNWNERRERQKEFIDEDPAVLVIGAGHAGLNIGFRLQHLGVKTLLIDRNERVGDSWRKRYRTLMTHDPIQYCHLPFIPFPTNWPLFVAKDKLADWLESYANVMELNVWTSTTLSGAEYDKATKTWTVGIRRPDGSTRVLRPRHIVLATGQAGDPIAPAFPGQSEFKGKVYHGSQHQDASLIPDLSNKQVLVVGSGNSSHDICQNFYENGAARVTMVQRGGSYVITASKGLFVMHKGMYDESGPPTEQADLCAQSMPIPVQFALNVHGTKLIAHVDRELLDGLAKAGFKLDFGPAGSGIYRKYITRGGGYYIDVGCSKLIADGKVKVHHSPHGIKRFTSTGLDLADGTTLDADIIVLATGYDGMKSSVRKILGVKVASRVNECWDLDGQGEINSIWRSSGHAGFWYMGGNLALCRSYSQLLALQIKALEEGLYSQVEV
ncbi:putative indole-3-pyruvate monooxygenase YUCCA8 [Colletotrichum trifolii]|uniref:Putative indole-3-pyruvate monooxygenase YUCCA8 n=1 Tax=Colletotrichum trifolii TaxID=5466 RepID=A0A4R8RFN5_COLTR|nr:putative indole-3-pyruvate monooxygenase YUCCA8 [Colletotrichum trifolii]